MSPGLIGRSPDLQRLRDEGYEVSVQGSYLVVGHIPYVKAGRVLAYGTLVSTLDLAGDRTTKPGTHVALWAGDYPCDSNGAQLQSLVNQQNMNERIREGLVATLSFSQKPRNEGYLDYYEKMTTYVNMMEGHAHVLDSGATARTFLGIKPDEDEPSVFNYLETASSRAGISAINEKLGRGKIAIVGLGGTGAYVLDLVAKTPVDEIHLFDGDVLLSHNAFRSPGAPTIDDLSAKPTKVDWFGGIYSRMRKKIVPHTQFVDESNVSELKGVDFVFLCIDGLHKKVIVDYLVQEGISFVDVGIGMYNTGDALGGSVRVTVSTPDHHDHLARRINYGEGADDEYSRNIQIADMNALNAALAVMKWKKLWGFYVDLKHEQNVVYSVCENLMTSDEIPNETQVNSA